MNKWIRGTVVLAVVAAIGLVAWKTLVGPARFTEAYATRVKPGMSLQEVEGRLGVPPGNYAHPKTLWVGSGPMIWWMEPEGWTDNAGQTWRTWIGDAGMILVVFDSDDKVVRASHADVLPPWPKGFWETVRRAVGDFIG
jgi:hypothetical protein